MKYMSRKQQKKYYQTLDYKRYQLKSIKIKNILYNKFCRMKDNKLKSDLHSKFEK